jgi:hypothetical protein
VPAWANWEYSWVTAQPAIANTAIKTTINRRKSLIIFCLLSNHVSALEIGRTQVCPMVKYLLTANYYEKPFANNPIDKQISIFSFNIQLIIVWEMN